MSVRFLAFAAQVLCYLRVDVSILPALTFTHLEVPLMCNRLWFLTLPAGLCFLPAAGADDTQIPEGFQSLFNGKDLSGWQVNKGGNMKVWGAENGLLYVNGSGGGWLMTDKEYGDFELRLE